MTLVKHVQKCATPVQIIAQDSREWNDVRHNAGNVLMRVANVQRNAGIVVVMLPSQHNNVLMPVVPVQKNAKSMTMNNANVVQKNVEGARLNAERLQLKFYEGFNMVKTLIIPVSNIFRNSNLC